MRRINAATLEVPITASRNRTDVERQIQEAIEQFLGEDASEAYYDVDVNLTYRTQIGGSLGFGGTATVVIHSE